MQIKINECLNKIECFDFDVFELDNLVGDQTLFYLSHEICNSLLFFEDLVNESKFKNFIQEITKGYYRSDVKYHNDLHASDVLQTLYNMIERGDVYYKCKLTELDTLAVILSAIVLNINVGAWLQASWNWKFLYY